MTEQPEQGSDASVEDRLAAYWSDGEKPAPEAAGEPEAVAEEADVEDADETPAEDDEIEDQLDGLTVRGKREAVEALKSERLMREDYTRKTQQVAALAKQAEDRLMFAEAREQILSAVATEYSTLQQSKTKLAQLQGLDMESLYNANPGQAFALQRQIDTLQQEVRQQEQQIGSKAQQLQAAMQHHRERQWQLANEAALQRLGPVSDADNAAMLRQVESLGFQAEELKGRFADPRFLQLVFKAAKYDAIQGGKTQAINSASKAPPVLKPGAVTNASAVSKEKALRKQLRDKGDSKTAARLLMKFM